MDIRKVTTDDDLEAIGEIYAQSWKTAYCGIVPQNYLDGLHGGMWAGVLSDSQYDAFVVCEDGKYIGASSICAARDEAMAGYGEIVSIYLLPEYFGKGYAAPLFNHVVNALLEKGYKDMYLWVLQENARAQKFYEKQGFSKHGDTLSFEIEGKEITDIRYIRKGY